MPFSKTGGVGGCESWKNFSLRLLLMPMYFFILWIFYYHGFEVKNTVFIKAQSEFNQKKLAKVSQFKLVYIHLNIHIQDGTTRENQYQRTYVTRNGLVFSSLAGAYFMSIITTACTFASERTRYYQVRNFFIKIIYFVIINIIL